MAKILNVIYSALVILVAIAGLGLVFWTPTSEDDGPRWQGLAAALFVLLFLLVMVGDLVILQS